MPMPSNDLRTNLATWAILRRQVPAIAHFMHDALPNESFDPHFYGQALETTYFDTPHYDLRKARANNDKYITLRIRCYRPKGEDEAYALSAKTEKEKFRKQITALDYYLFTMAKHTMSMFTDVLPPNFVDRLLAITNNTKPIPIVTISCQRYAIEDDQDRFTLDTDIHTSRGRDMSFSVLEFKSTKRKEPPAALQSISLTPIKLSKFLWATTI